MANKNLKIIELFLPNLASLRLGERSFPVRVYSRAHTIAITEQIANYSSTKGSEFAEIIFVYFVVNSEPELFITLRHLSRWR